MKPTLLGALAAAICLTSCGDGQLKLREDNIDSIVAAMTLQEKALLVTGIGMDGQDNGESATIGSSADLVPGAAGSTHAIPRLGIPQVVLADGPAGLRINPTREGDSLTYYCTHFPIGTLLASTWDEQLVAEVGAAIGNEVLEYGADVLLAPALNIHRNPLCGRNFEYYSEDPILAGKTAAAYVRGVQSQGVGTSIKHFALNNQETNRTGNDALVSAPAVRMIYLKGFEIAVRESDPWTVMTSYNKLNGTYTSEDHTLVEDILRGEWGYRGTVMTDWFGGKDAAAQMRAGNDMLQPGRATQYRQIVESVEQGTLDVADLDRNVRRILQLVVRTPRFRGYRYSNRPDLQAHAAVTRQSATEGMVLLENKRAALPLGQDVSRVAVYGVTSYDFIAGGTGSGNVNRAYTVSLLDGLQNVGYTIDPQVQQRYVAYRQQVAAERALADSLAKDGPNAFMSQFLPKPLPAEIVPTASELAASVRDNDVAIVTLGRISGEFLDRTTADFQLSAAERQLLTSVCGAFQRAGKRVIVVLNVGGVIETASWKALPDAILLAWQAGQEGGNSVADVLSGRVSPSGRLPMTWPVRLEDHGSTANFPRAEQFGMNLNAFMGKDDEEREPVELWDYTPYAEGVMVGYRWFDRNGIEPSYPFGYGLSYTTFQYANAQAECRDGRVTVTVDVRNAGQVASREVVQLYAANPGNVDMPPYELRAFAKTPLLQPGQTHSVTLSFPVSDLSIFNADDNCWLPQSGDYELCVGASSRDVRASVQVSVL